MLLRTFVNVSLVTLWVSGVAESLAAKPSEQETMRQSSTVLDQIMSAPAQAIPRQLLSNCQAVAIVPQVKGGAFVIGIRKGHGVLIVRDKDGLWRAPQFIEMTGGSIGWQAGVQSSDVILVFRSYESLQNLMSGKLTIGADASIAAGPVGRQIAAATDLMMAAEIYSYSRSRGAFLGVSLDGTVIKADPQADARYYHSLAVPGQPHKLPATAGHLVSRIAQYTKDPYVTMNSGSAPVVSQDDSDECQRILAESSERLFAILDPPWQQYLALPQGVYEPRPLEANDLIMLEACLLRYEEVAENPAYSTLTTKREFQSVLLLLRQAVLLRRSTPPPPITLPPPPGETQSSGPSFPR